MYTLLMKGDREESLLIIKKINQTALDLGNRHFPLSRAALIGVLTWCVGLLDQHYSSTPHHRRFVRSITNGSGGVGFMSLLMRGAITAVSCRTVGDVWRITAGSKTVI